MAPRPLYGRCSGPFHTALDKAAVLTTGLGKKILCLLFPSSNFLVPSPSPSRPLRLSCVRRPRPLCMSIVDFILLFLLFGDEVAGGVAPSADEGMEMRLRCCWEARQGLGLHRCCLFGRDPRPPPSTTLQVHPLSHSMNGFILSSS
jgi:hypothetical protein